MASDFQFRTAGTEDVVWHSPPRRTQSSTRGADFNYVDPADARTKTKVAIIDDSSVARQLLGLLVRSSSNLSMCGSAGSAEAGWSLICKTMPHVVLLDLELPGRSGFDLLKRIQSERPVPVIVVSALGAKGSPHAASAMAAGAADVIPKPDVRLTSSSDFANTLYAAIRRLTVPRQPTSDSRSKLFDADHNDPSQQSRVAAIGAPAGSTFAIGQIALGLVGTKIPVVVTQHLAASDHSPHLDVLLRAAGVDAREACTGDALVPGRVLVAPRHAHLSFSGTRMAPVCLLDEGPAVNGYMPSIDAMFRSVAETLGPKGIGIILEGAGRDGTLGLMMMRECGALTVCASENGAETRSRESMFDLGAADEHISIRDTAAWIVGAAAEQPLPPPK